jgi:hypothetical protein
MGEIFPIFGNNHKESKFHSCKNLDGPELMELLLLFGTEFFFSLIWFIKLWRLKYYQLLFKDYAPGLSDFTTSIYFLDIPRLFCLSVYIGRQYSEFLMHSLLVNILSIFCRCFMLWQNLWVHVLYLNFESSRVSCGFWPIVSNPIHEKLYNCIWLLNYSPSTPLQ